MKKEILLLTFYLLCVISVAHAQNISFGNYVYRDNTSDSRQEANNAIIEAAQRAEQNQYRTYDDIYLIKHPEQCEFESYTEPNTSKTYYVVTIPELGVSVDCKYPSFERKRIYMVRLVKNGNGKIIKYGLAE